MKTPAFAVDGIAKQIARTRAGISKSFFMVSLFKIKRPAGVVSYRFFGPVTHRVRVRGPDSYSKGLSGRSLQMATSSS
jgi:hypothetical protein